MTLTRYRSVLLGVSLHFLAALCCLASTRLIPEDAPQETLVIEHITVLPMIEGGQPLDDCRVLVRDGRIVSVEPHAPASNVDEGRHIDGRGKWLIPGLTDMHVHVDNVRILRLMLRRSDIPQAALRNEDIFLPYVANGVLQIFSLQSMSETIGQRVEIEAGRVLGPRIIAAAMIDGADPIWPLGTVRSVATVEGARQAVRDAAAEGYDAIKVYSRLELDTFTAIVDEARLLHLPVVGHIPGRGKGGTSGISKPVSAWCLMPRSSRSAARSPRSRPFRPMWN